MDQITTRPFSPKNTHAIRQNLGGAALRRLQAASRVGWAWVAWFGSKPVAWATAVSLPGLAGVVELDGAVSSPYRQRGIGTAVLADITPPLQQAGVVQISCALNAPDTAVASFLRNCGFEQEHVEWEMVLDDLSQLPPQVYSGEFLHLPRAEAIVTFVAFHERSFGPTAWYQPFTQAEVAGGLTDSQQIYFWRQNGALIGFAWIHAEEPGVVRIEPIGILPEWQGLGHGRGFLLALLHQLVAQGHKEVRMGVWRRNETAVGLYRKLGFHMKDTTTFLALNLNTA